MSVIYDLVGVGIGPFNLGLAALCDDIEGFNCFFLDKKDRFAWHSGMLLDNAKLQVPFYADLVTLVNPKSRFSYLCFLKDNSRLYRFAIREDYFPLRKEYNDYCNWVCNQLNCLKFNSEVNRIVYDHEKELFEIFVSIKKGDGGNKELTYLAKHIVIGIGSIPLIPNCVDVSDPLVLHSSRYLYNKPKLAGLNDITVVGSGQSSAEIFNDLLCESNNSMTNLSWITRANRFFPMDYSSFSLEMTSPEYIDYFFGLDDGLKDSLLKDHAYLYKGINKGLIDRIYDLLYVASIQAMDSATKIIKSSSELLHVVKSSNQFICQFKQIQTGNLFTHKTDALILGTGYEYVVPDFIAPIKDLLEWDASGRYRVKRNYSIDTNNRVFIQNAEIHSHGFNAPDLGMGPYRNAVIINTILKKPYFSLETNIAFQHFG